MEARRSREIAATPADVWRVVGDARELPRWWPRVERVEGVRGGAWTTVLRSPRGRVVRADWRLDGEERGARRAWTQQIEGTPFERVIVERRVEARLAPAGEGTLVTLAMRQRSRKLGRLGDAILLRPARRELDEALGALAAAVEARPGDSSPQGGDEARPGDSSPQGGDEARPDDSSPAGGNEAPAS